jgi:hypothetical protein
MIEQDAIHKRGQALENEYFQRVDQQLLKELRESEARATRLAELMKATGLHDEEVASHLLDADIDASNVAALTLTPLVFVAWASGTVSAEERQGVISAALRRGVNSDATAFRLLEQWLQNRPRRELWKLWTEYARALHESLPAATADKLSQRLMEQAELVAKASGGFLGMGKVCAAEQRVLDEIHATLPKRSAV